MANATLADPGTLRSSFWAFTRQAIRRPLFLVSPAFATLDLLTLQAPSASRLRRSGRARSSGRSALDHSTPQPHASNPNPNVNGSGSGPSAASALAQSRNADALLHARASSQPAPSTSGGAKSSRAAAASGSQTTSLHVNPNPSASANPNQTPVSSSLLVCNSNADTPIRHTCGREADQTALPTDPAAAPITTPAQLSMSGNPSETSDCAACRLDSMSVTSVQMFDALLSYCGFRSAKRILTYTVYSIHTEYIILALISVHTFTHIHVRVQ